MKQITTTNCRIRHADGSPATGKLTVAPSVPFEYTDAATAVKVTQNAVTVDIVNGQLAAPLLLAPCAGASVLPVGASYRVTFRFGGVEETQFWVIQETDPAVIELTDLAVYGSAPTVVLPNYQAPFDPAREGGNLATAAAKLTSLLTAVLALTKPADQQHVIVDAGTLTAVVDEATLATSANQAMEIANLSAILAKLSGDPATQTTLAAVKADLDALNLAVATAAKQDTGNASLATLVSKDFATQTTLAAVLAKLSGDPATQTTLAAILAKLSSDPATQTTLAAVKAALDTLNAAVATAAKQDTGNTSLAGIKADLDSLLTTVATAANQATANTSLAGIKTDLDTLVTRTPADPAKESGHLATIDTSTAAVSSATGATTDAAVTGDNPGTVSAKLRGLLKVIASKIGVTIADGDNATQGALADAAIVTDAAGSVSGKLRGIVKLLATGITLPVGAAKETGGNLDAILAAAQLYRDSAAILAEGLMDLASAPVLGRVIDDGAGALNVTPWANTTKAQAVGSFPMQTSGPLAITTVNALAVNAGPVDQRWEIMQRSNLEWDAIRQRFTFGAFAANFRLGLDRLPWRWGMFAPNASAAGACLATDPRGTNRYVYCLFNATAFYRYDSYTDTYEQLASPPGVTVNQTAMVVDVDNNRVWLMTASGVAPTFQYYDIAANTWTSRSVTSAPATLTSDISLVHTATANGGNGDFIYLAGNNATTFYRYSISGNSWSSMTAVTAAPGSGCGLIWDYSNAVDSILCWRGGATATLYKYSIAGNSWSTLTPTPATETYTTGTYYAYSPTEKRVYIRKEATGRLKYYDTVANTYTPYSQSPWADSTAVVGNRMVYLKSPDGFQSLWLMRHSGVETFGVPLGLGA